MHVWSILPPKTSIKKLIIQPDFKTCTSWKEIKNVCFDDNIPITSNFSIIIILAPIITTQGFAFMQEIHAFIVIIFLIIPCLCHDRDHAN